MAPTVAAGIPPAVEPGFLPGGENPTPTGTGRPQREAPALSSIHTGRLEAALYIRPEA